MAQPYEVDSIKAAQAAMRSQYLNGATGVLVSGLVWLTTSFVVYRYSTQQAVWALLVGGALIHPLSTGVNYLLGAKAAGPEPNGLRALALESTFFMLMTIPLAYGLSLLRPAWFFQGMLLIIGGRYFTFHTLYGSKLFWLLGSVLGVSAYGLFATHTQPLETTLTGAAIEIVFGSVLFYAFASQKKGDVAAL